MKLLIVQSPHPSITSSLLGPQYLPQYPILKHLQLIFLPYCERYNLIVSVSLYCCNCRHICFGKMEMCSKCLKQYPQYHLIRLKTNAINLSVKTIVQ